MTHLIAPPMLRGGFGAGHKKNPEPGTLSTLVNGVEGLQGKSFHGFCIIELLFTVSRGQPPMGRSAAKAVT